MLSAFTNTLKIPELRQRIFFTLGLVFVARVGANIPLPGLDPTPLQAYFADQTTTGGGSLLGLANMFTGGALLKGAVFALGIMPYISASIIFQLLAAGVPALARLQQEGESGRQKITQYTRYATVVICLIQAPMLVLTLENPTQLFQGFNPDTYGNIVLVDHWLFLVSSVIILTAGTVLLMWLGEQITQRGVGNGVSLLITIGILAELPNALSIGRQMFFPDTAGTDRLELPVLVIMLVLLFVVIAAIVAVTQATRKIPVQYAKRVVGRKTYGGQSSFLPLKVNYSGVMPVIFGSAILLFLQQIISGAGRIPGADFMIPISNAFAYGSISYYVIFGLLILIFAYFWVSMMFKPVQIADDLKKYGGYIPGVRPGDPTAKFLDFVMTRLTLAGSIFLVIIALFPSIVLTDGFGVPYSLAQFFGGTGMMIIVGVLLDSMRQIETYLLQRHYDGFLKKGRIRGRSVGRTRQVTAADVGEIQGLGKLWAALGAMFAFGIVAWLLQNV